MLVRDGNIINAGFSGIGNQHTFCGQGIAQSYGFCKIHRTVQRNRSFIGVVARKSQRRICQRKRYAAVNRSQTIYHFLLDGHFDEAVFFADLNKFYPHPLGEMILIEHVLGEFVWSHKMNLKM